MLVPGERGKPVGKPVVGSGRVDALLFDALLMMSARELGKCLGIRAILVLHCAR